MKELISHTAMKPGVPILLVARLSTIQCMVLQLGRMDRRFEGIIKVASVSG